MSAVRLDDVAGDWPPPRVVKIDVEGAETAVLRGASRLLREARRWCSWRCGRRSGRKSTGSFGSTGTRFGTCRGLDMARYGLADVLFVPDKEAARRP